MANHNTKEEGSQKEHFGFHGLLTLAICNLDVHLTLLSMKAHVFNAFLCGLHKVLIAALCYDLIYLFIYLFVYERQAPVTWSSVYGAIVFLARVIFSNDRITS